MRISDWSSDVCSSDLDLVEHPGLVGVRGVELGARDLAVLVRIHRGNAALAFLRLVGAAGSFLGLVGGAGFLRAEQVALGERGGCKRGDRQSTRLNSSH